MLYWCAVAILIALAASWLGSGQIAALAILAAKILFVVFLVLLVLRALRRGGADPRRGVGPHGGLYGPHSASF